VKQQMRGAWAARCCAGSCRQLAQWPAQWHTNSQRPAPGSYSLALGLQRYTPSRTRGVRSHRARAHTLATNPAETTQHSQPHPAAGSIAAAPAPSLPNPFSSPPSPGCSPPPASPLPSLLAAPSEPAARGGRGDPAAPRATARRSLQMEALAAAGQAPRRGSEAAAGPQGEGSQLENQQCEDFCRLCWGEREEGSAWELVSPCSCSGSLRHIHRKWVAQALRALSAPPRHGPFGCAHAAGG
jgi:hypothetical protein